MMTIAALVAQESAEKLQAIERDAVDPRPESKPLAVRQSAGEISGECSSRGANRSRSQCRRRVSRARCRPLQTASASAAHTGAEQRRPTRRDPCDDLPRESLEQHARSPNPAFTLRRHRPHGGERRCVRQRRRATRLRRPVPRRRSPLRLPSESALRRLRTTWPLVHVQHQSQQRLVRRTRAPVFMFRWPMAARNQHLQPAPADVSSVRAHARTGVRAPHGNRLQLLHEHAMRSVSRHGHLLGNGVAGHAGVLQSAAARRSAAHRRVGR